MNNDLISRKALRDKLTDTINVNDITKSVWYEGYAACVQVLSDLIDNAPTVSFMISPDYVTELQNLNKNLVKQLEEAEKPQGEWIDLDTDESWYRFKCNNCLTLFPRGMFMKGYPYCPKCGADMRGDENGQC